MRCRTKRRAVLTDADEIAAGVADRRRLDEIARLALHGHLADAGLDAVVETVAAALAVPMAAVNIVTPNLQTYAAEVGLGVPCTTVPDDRSFCTEVVNTGQPLIVPDAPTHPVYRENPLVVSGQIGAYAGYPLVHRGAVLGSVCAFHDRPRAFTATELRILAAQARLAATVLSLRHAATHDSLTGLANRARGAEFAAQALAMPPASVLFADIDDFKTINDRHGHHGGDQVLRELARQLEGALEGTPHLAVRWGGDEFLVIMPGADADAAQAVADRLLQAARPAHAPVAVGLTVGVATAGNRCDLDELVRLASAAAARGKKVGKGLVHTDGDDRSTASVRKQTRG